jgi:hypothetical protein
LDTLKSVFAVQAKQCGKFIFGWTWVNLFDVSYFYYYSLEISAKQSLLSRSQQKDLGKNCFDILS